jgi:hypothetical protein
VEVLLAFAAKGKGMGHWMGNKNGYLPETPAFKGTRNVSVAHRQQWWQLEIFIYVFYVGLLFVLVDLCVLPSFDVWCSCSLSLSFSQ